MNLLRKAVRIAQQEGLGSILTLKVLGQAYDKRVAGHVNKVNPFDLPPAANFVAPPPVLADDPEGVNGRSRRGKEKKPTIAETLKT